MNTFKVLQKKNHQLEKRNQELEILIKDIKTADFWLKSHLEKRLKEVEGAKEKAEKNNRFNSDIIRIIDAALIVIDPEARIIRVNPRLTRLLAYEEKELINQPLRNIFAEETIASFKGSKMKELVRQGSIKDFDVTCRTKSGKTIPIRFSASVMFDEESKLRGIVGVIRDKRDLEHILQKERMFGEREAKIEAQHKMSAELVKASLKLRELEHIINNSPAIVFLWRASHGWPVEFVSNNIRQFGYRPEDFYFKKLHFSSIVHPDDLARMIEEVNRYNKEGRDSFFQEYRIITKSGKVRWLNDHTWVRRDKDGIITHYQGILLDITESKRQVAELLQTEKMAAIGTMATSVAHELRNPLSVIQFAIENIDRRVGKENAKIKRPISNIRKKLKESEKIIKDLLSYSRLSKPVFERTDINLLLKEAISSVAIAFQDKPIEAITNLGKIPKANVDRIQILEVFQNIIRNAYEAIGVKKGTLTISTRYVRSKNQVGIAITDTGCGISKSDIKNLSKPFFSTKTKGTGLGLAVVFRIVKENHKGQVEVKSKLGEGTCFTIKLPV